MSSDPKVQPRIFLVVVAQGTYDHWDQLTEIETAAKELVEALCQPGSKFEWHLQTFLQGGTAPQLLQELDDWLQATVTERDRLILYWTGHATRMTNFYFILRNSPRQGITTTKAVTPDDLGDVLGNCRAEKKLFFIDTCYSGDGATEFVKKTAEMAKLRTNAPGQAPYIGVIPATHSLLKAREAVFCRALREVLTASEAKHRTWEDDDEWIRVGDLIDAVYSTVQERIEGWQAPLPVTMGYGARFLPNPRYRSNLRLDVETSRLLAARVQIPDPLRLAGRGAVAGEHELYFTGRTALRQKLASWLTDPRPRLAALTGPPGVGKSAVLGRLLLSADPDFQAEIAAIGLESADDVPVLPSGTISAAVHVRAKTVGQTAQAIAEQIFAGADEPPLETEALLRRLRELPAKGAIVVDALDEAAEPYPIGTLLRRLVEEGNCRVLVGTRRSPDGRIIPEEEERHGRLQQLFGEAAELMDLEDEVQADADIATYVYRRLQQSQQPRSAEAIGGIAQKVAAQANGNFLYARIIARTLQEAKTLEGALPVGPIAALAEDIRQRFPEQEELVHGLFRGLAWAEGEGVSRACWPAIATALADGEREFTAAEVTWALENVGWHILQAQEDGQTVFRLVHQAFTDYYLQYYAWRQVLHRKIEEQLAAEISDQERLNADLYLQRYTTVQARWGEAHREIAEQLAAGISGLGWLDADPYVHRYLAVHARRGGILRQFVMDPVYLVTAKAGPLISRLYAIEDADARRMMEIYRRAVHAFAAAQIPERMALLEMAARQNDPELAKAFQPLLKPHWQCLWAHWRPTVPSVAIAKQQGTLGPFAVPSQTFGPLEHTLLIGQKGRELCGWWLDEMREAPQRALLEGNITAIAVADGANVAIVGTDRGELAIYSLPDFVKIGNVMGAHPSAVRHVIAFWIGSESYFAVVGAGNELSLWQLNGLKLLTMREDATPPDASIIFAEWRGKPVLVTSGDPVGDSNKKPLRIWSLPDLSLLASFGEERVYVGSMHFVRVKQKSVLLGAGWTYLFAWNLDTLEPLFITSSSNKPQAQYFLSVSTSEEQAEILVAYNAQAYLLTIHGSTPEEVIWSWTDSKSDKVYLDYTPWVETEYGRWLGPVWLWRGKYAVSLHHEIRVWSYHDLLEAIRTAPEGDHMMENLQQSYGSPSVTSRGGELFVIRDSGSLECFSASEGIVRWSDSIWGGGRPKKICYFTTGTSEVLAVGLNEQIHLVDPISGKTVLRNVNLDGMFRDFQPIRMAGAVCLALLENRIWDLGHYIVRFLRLPDLVQVSPPPGFNPARLVVPKRYQPMRALAVAESATGAVIIAVGDGPGILVWRGEGFGEALELQPWPESRDTTSVVVIPHAQETRFVVGTHDGRIALLACRLQQPLLFERTHGGEDVTVSVVSWGGKLAIASGSSDEKLRLWTLDLELLDEIDIGAWINQIVAISAEMLAIATNRGVIVVQSSSSQ